MRHPVLKIWYGYDSTFVYKLKIDKFWHMCSSLYLVWLSLIWESTIYHLDFRQEMVKQQSCDRLFLVYEMFYPTSVSFDRPKWNLIGWILISQILHHSQESPSHLSLNLEIEKNNDLHCVTKSLFFELESSNYGCLLIFQFCWAVQSFNKIGHHWH